MRERERKRERERERERETFASASGLSRRLRSQKWLYDQQEDLARFMAKI
jgi:hypothetical protein